MVVETTSERLLLDYIKAILKATTKEELNSIDDDITYDDDVSTKGYGILMNVINLKEETLK